ncbi:MAG: cytoskeletal protein CcmA (bactofilin family) [Myxococcota bacterium]
MYATPETAVLMLTLAASLALAVPSPADDAVLPEPHFEMDQQVDLVESYGDVFAAGESVHVGASIGDNAFLAGEDVHIDSDVYGDVFATGSTLRIDARVHGDVYAFGKEVTVGPTGSVGGHLLAGCSELDIQGPVSGGVQAGAGQVVIGAPIGGDVQIEAGELLVVAGGHIGGDLTYTTPVAAPDVASIVDGEVSWKLSVDETPDGIDVMSSSSEAAGGGLLGWFLWTLWSFLSKLSVGAVLLLVGGKLTARAGRLLGERPTQSLGAGLAGLGILPLLSIAACLMVIGLPLGMMGLLLYGALLYISQLVAAQALGDQILRRFRPDAWGSPVISMAIGLAPLVLLMALPWAGGLVWFVATVLGFGALSLRMRELVSE